MSNKQIAAKLNISPRTVETYRAWVMERIGAQNVADLVLQGQRVSADGIRSSRAPRLGTFVSICGL